MSVPEWNVIRFNSMRGEFEPYNVLSRGFLANVKDRTKKLKTREEFTEEVNRICVYDFWSKYEWEIVLKEWGSETRALKQKTIDVYWQLRLNWDRFIDYLWGEVRK